jgi:signal transduction histidine kinase
VSKSKHDNQRVIELSELAGGLAHEIRNPLSTLKVNLQLLAEDLGMEANADLRRRSLQRLETLQSETERLQILLDNFLRLVSGHEINTRPVDIGKVVRHLVEFFTPRAEEMDIRMRLRLSDEELICELDESLIQQALLNLCLNAQQSMPDGGELIVETAAEDDWARIDVTDTGIGIAAEALDKLFKPFFSTRKGGSGLGLSVTRRIVSEHGGTIEVQSEPGKGSRFTVRVPRSP